MKTNESLSSPEVSQYAPQIDSHCFELVLDLVPKDSLTEPGEVDLTPMALTAEVSSGSVSYVSESNDPHWEWTWAGEERETKKRLSQLVLSVINGRRPEELSSDESEWLTAVNQAIAAINTVEILRREFPGSKGRNPN